MTTGRLVIDEAGLELIAKKVQGMPVYAGPGGNLLEPGTIDLVEREDAGDRWQPGDKTTKLLLHGWEAVDEVRAGVVGFAAAVGRRRVLKNLSVPICNLMDVTHQLCNQLNDTAAREARAQWPKHDQDTYVAVGRRFRKDRLHGPVRRVRNRLAAHLDPDAFQDDELKISVDDFLGALGDTIILFMLTALRHPSHFFCWIRPLGEIPERQLSVVETMYGFPACLRLYVGPDGHVRDVERISLAADPRRPVQQSVDDVIALYSAMVDASSNSMSRIWTAPTDELRKSEAEKSARTE